MIMFKTCKEIYLSIAISSPQSSFAILGPYAKCSVAVFYRLIVVVEFRSTSSPVAQQERVTRIMVEPLCICIARLRVFRSLKQIIAVRSC